MGCGSSKAPPPDPNIGKAQVELSNLATRQQDYFEKNFAPQLLNQMNQQTELARTQAGKQAEMQDFQMGLARKYDQRYWGTQVPLEDSIISEAKNYNTAAERERMAGEAGADVQQAFDNSQAQLTRGLRGMGVNPGSAGSIAALSDMQTQRALAQAGAMNKTREAARQLGWTRMGEAAALGRGLPGFGQGSTQLAMGAGQAAVGAGAGALGAVGTAAQVSNGNTNAQGSLWSSVGNIGVQKYNADVNAANSGNSMGGLMGGIGGIMQGLGSMGYSSKKLKTNKRGVDESGVLKGINRLKVESWDYKPGVADEGAHVGPYAEDVQREFGDHVAPGGRMLDMREMSDVNMRGIQELTAKLSDLEHQIARLER